MLKIFLKFNDAVLKEVESDQPEITIGRNARNDIQIDNMAVSRQHARIIRSLSCYYIEDLNSTNGTFVNQEKISTRSLTELKENDEITVGKHTLAIAFKRRGEQISDIATQRDVEKPILVKLTSGSPRQALTTKTALTCAVT